MVYKKYYINILIRVILILINMLVFSYTFLETSYAYTIVFLGFLIFIQSAFLIRYLNQSNIFLERFLNYIKEGNTSINFFKSLENSPFNGLSNYLEEINKIIADAKIDKENQYLFLQYIFEHVNIGLIAFDSNNNVQLINKASKDLLNITGLKNINFLDKINLGLAKSILSLKPGDQKILPSIIDGKNLQISVKFSKFKLLNSEISLISLQDIKAELDYKEIESWQKLNRVLTHEIMNSVSPIIGLSNNISKHLRNKSVIKKHTEFNDEIIEQTAQSINIIEERSQGLKNFVQNFRSITSAINPEPQNIRIKELIEGLSIFMHDIFSENNIQFSFSVLPENLEVFIDKKLFEQVLINLIKNSVEALEEAEEKILKIKAIVNKNEQKIIQIIDNGKGISPDIIDLIFTPFYTSKENGSGIGLSLSKNILKQHGYSIDVRSIQGKETIFTLYL